MCVMQFVTSTGITKRSNFVPSGTREAIDVVPLISNATGGCGYFFITRDLQDTPSWSKHSLSCIAYP